MLDESMPTSDCTPCQFRQRELSAYTCSALLCQPILAQSIQQSFAGTSSRSNFQENRFSNSTFRNNSFSNRSVPGHRFHSKNFRISRQEHNSSNSVHSTNFDDDIPNDSLEDKPSQEAKNFQDRNLHLRQLRLYDHGLCERQLVPTQFLLE